MKLEKKPIETTDIKKYAETTSTEVKLSLKHTDFFVNYVKKTVRSGNFFILLYSHVSSIHMYSHVAATKICTVM